jgi:hypothetical protein
MGVSFEDVCAFLEDQNEEAEAFDSLVPYYPPPTGQAAAAPQAPSSTKLGKRPAPSDDSKAMSHICNWPGCGKGFTSRWTLERHAKNHQPAAPGESEPTPDSFVERRLRERLKSLQVALEKVREKHAQHVKQQQQADAELSDARKQSQAQQSEILLLSAQNERMRAALPPAVAQRLSACAGSAFGPGPLGYDGCGSGGGGGSSGSGGGMANGLGAASGSPAAAAFGLCGACGATSWPSMGVDGERGSGVGVGGSTGELS